MKFYKKIRCFILHGCKINKKIAFSLYLAAFRLFAGAYAEKFRNAKNFLLFRFLLFFQKKMKEYLKTIKFYKKIHLHVCQINKKNSVFAIPCCVPTVRAERMRSSFGTRTALALANRSRRVAASGAE